MKTYLVTADHRPLSSNDEDDAIWEKFIVMARTRRKAVIACEIIPGAEVSTVLVGDVELNWTAIDRVLCHVVNKHSEVMFQKAVESL